MWIFSQKAFLSIVRHIDKANVLIVRSRFRGHIESIFPKAHVTEDAERDYKYRVELPAKEVSKALAELVLGIRYENFKNSLDMNDERYFESCISVYNSVLINSQTNTLVIENEDSSQFQYLREEPNEG